jgi:HEAT repeat protein
MVNTLFIAVLAWVVPAWACADTAFLRDALMSSDPATASQAVAQIESLPPSERKGLVLNLITTLRKNESSAIAAARALGACGKDAEDAVPDLIEALRYDDAAVTTAVGDALIKIGPASIRPLLRALDDPNFVVRQRSAEIIGGFGAEAKKAAPQLAELLVDPQSGVQTAAANTLIKIGEPAIPAVAGALKRRDPAERTTLISFLTRFGAPAAPVLLQSLRKDENPSVRVNAANGLGAIQPAHPATIAALIEAMKDPNEYVRTAAINALNQSGAQAKAAIGPLIQLSRLDSEALPRQRSLQALESIGRANKDSLPGLSDNFKVKDGDVRRLSIIALGEGELTPEEPLPLLALAMKDSDGNVRLQAVQVVSALVGKTASAVTVLRPALADPQKNVRAAAIEAMGGASASPEAAAITLEGPLKDPDPGVRNATIDSLGRLGPPAIPILIYGLLDAYSVVAARAEMTIIQMGPAAIPELEKVKTRPDPFLQKKADALIADIQPTSKPVAKPRSKPAKK